MAQRSLFSDVNPPDVTGMIRRRDAFTAVDAASVVAPHRSALQLAVLQAFRDHANLTDSELELLPEFSTYAYSTVRKRRTELVQQGELVCVGERVNNRKRKMQLWALRRP